MFCVAICRLRAALFDTFTGTAIRGELTSGIPRAFLYCLRAVNKEPEWSRQSVSKVYSVNLWSNLLPEGSSI